MSSSFLPRNTFPRNTSIIHKPGDLVNKAQVFNEFFADVGKTTYEETQALLQSENIKAIVPNAAVSSNITRVRPQPADTTSVVSTIKQLQETQSFGSDGISLRFIKDSLYVIAFYLTTIITTSIVTGTFPAAWKHALVVPLHKKGDPADTNNYRPISLLPTFSKILEKIVATQLVEHLEKN